MDERPQLEVIAETAQGFAGDDPLAKALLLVRLAAAAGADYIKFQLVIADEMAVKSYEHYQLFQSLEMSEEDWFQVERVAADHGLGLVTDVFGSASLQISERIGVVAVKVHGTDLLNHALLREVTAGRLDVVILGVGGSLRAEIAAAVDILREKNVVLMHGFQALPTPASSNQIARLTWFASEFPHTRIGFADHVPFDKPERTWLSAVAVGAGATIIEKHITTALSLREEDHEAALNPDEFARFVADMKLASLALGPPPHKDAEDFGMSVEERDYRATTKKHVVAARPMAKGQRVTADSIGLKRTPCTDDLYVDPLAVVGRTVLHPLAVDDPVRKRDID